MKKPLVLAVACAVLASPLAASDAPKGDFFAGYSYWKVDEESRNGWQASLAKNFGKLGAVLDVSGHYKNGSDDLTFMAGPRYAFHGAKITPFVQVLAGGVRLKSGIKVLNVSISESETHFAWAAGAGVSFKVSSHWDVRVQGDYLSVSLEGGSEANPRFSGGLAYRF